MRSSSSSADRFVCWLADSRFLGLESGEEVEFGQVVEDDHDGEDQDADEGYLVDALFELLIEIAAKDAFDQEEQDHAAVEDRDRQKVEDAEVQADVGHQADEGHPAGHLNGLVDLGADADGAAQAADRDLTREHAAEDFDDEQGALFVVIPRGDHGLAEGQALYLDGGLDVLESEAVVLDAVATVSEFGRDLHGHLLSVAEDHERGGLAGLVLQVGEQGRYGVELEAVDGEDLVLGLEAGADGGHVGLKGVDLDWRGLHFGDEA